MKLTFILFIVIIPFVVNCQLAPEHKLYSNCTIFSNVTYGYLNNDNYKDFIFSDGTSGKHIMYSNLNGSGELYYKGTLQINYSAITALVMSSAFICDLDGDGKNDILSNSEYLRKTSWFKNIDNNWNFDSESVIIDTASYRYIYPADIDLDNDTDIFLFRNNHLSWLKNDGNGNFSLASLISDSIFFTYSFCVNDYDNDNDYDIIIPNIYGKIDIYTNDGNGNFIGSLIILNSPIYDIKVIDIDNDGDKDFYLRMDSTISWIENINNSFSTQPVHIDTIYFGNNIHLTDYDSDNDIDILYSDSLGVFLYMNVGNGSFLSPQLISNLNFEITILGFSDLNNDGYQDIIGSITNDYDQIITILYDNNSYGPTITPFMNGYIFPKSLKIKDINNDGAKDLIFGGYGTINILKNLNGYMDYSFLSSFIDTGYHRVIVIADIDNDNDQDIISNSNNNLYWYENINQSFNNKHFICDSIGYGDIAKVQDIDGDSDIDIVVYSNLLDNISWYENNGNGVFTQSHYIDYVFGTNNFNFYIEDIDLDNHPDIVLGNDYARWYRNDGSGLFTSMDYIPFLQNTSIKTGDVDTDGDIDIIGYNYFGLCYYENDGNGNFSSFNQIDNTGIVFSDFLIMDIDNDQDNDIIAVSLAEILLFENDNNSFITDTLNYPFHSFYKSNLFAADLDNDGDIELLTSNDYTYGDMGIKVYANNTIYTNQIKDINPLNIKASVYPNPCSDKCTIQISNEASSAYELIIFSITGKKIIHERNLTDSLIEIDLQQYHSGMYICKLISVSGSTTEFKLILSK
ncbi:MAG: VCBS repeat-containing protein [Marinilabiliales bacterium]